jgi:TetR/AcrR family transcriptional regulator, copper-responsive repressor
MNRLDAGARPGRPITRNRAHVLETAMNAYWQDDRAAVSVNAVCALAGVSKPSLYRDFGSEDGLTAAVLEHYGQSVLVGVEALLSGPQSYGAKLDALVSFASDDPQMEAGCLFVKMRATRSRFGPQTQALLAAMEAHFQAQYERFFVEAAGRGEWRGGIATDLAASYLQEQIGLAVSQRAAGKPSEAVRAFLALAVSVLR